MHTPKTIAFFDFDGTITKYDSLLHFLIYTAGLRKVCGGFFVLCPVLLLYKLGVIDNGRAKEIVLGWFFKNWDEDIFTRRAEKFSRDKIPGILRPVALERINWHKARGHEIVIVSASAEDWLRVWCESIAVGLIATRLEKTGGRLTGRISGENCSGHEKARRIREAYDLADYGYVYAYGDSSGDREMLALANEKYYKWVRQS